MNTATRTLSALLAGAMLLSLSACSGGEEPTNGGSASTAASAAEAVPQGRWVEQEATGIPADVALTGAPAALEDGTLVAYGQQGGGNSSEDYHTVRLTSADNGATWQCETPAWAADTGVLVTWALRPDGTTVFAATDGTSWRVGPDGAVTQLDLLEVATGAVMIDQMCFLADGTLAVLPAAGGGTMTEGEGLPGAFFFYDVDAAQVKAWVQTPGGDGTIGWASGSMDEDGNVTYFGANDIPEILPGQDADGTVFAYYLTVAGDLCRADLDGTTQTVQAGFLENAYVPVTVDAGGGICYLDSTGLYRQVPGGGLTEQVLAGSGMTFSLESWYLASLSCAPDGSYLAVLRNMGEDISKLYRYAFDETLSAPTETLEVWSLNENSTMRAAIQAFAQEHPECSVEYEPVLSGDTGLTAEDALRTLNTELLAGDGPDVLLLDGTDAEAFADSGLLADLSAVAGTADLYDFVTAGYTREDGTVAMLPGRFSVPVLCGAAGSLDGVTTLDDVAALVAEHPARPGGDVWIELEEDQRYALAFDSVESLVKFALQTSQPALLTGTGLDEAALQDLLAFVQAVGDHYGMGNWPEQMTASGSMGNFGGVDAISWEAGMAEYALVHRAVYGFGTMGSPTWLAANDPEGEAGGQTILQPGLSTGVWTPGCLTAVSAASDQQELALDLVAALLSEGVQGSYQNDGMPVTKAGMQATLDRNREEMESHGYTGGLDELLAQLTTPVQVDDGLFTSLMTHSKALLQGSETVDQAAAGVQQDLALRFAERQ